MSKYYETKHDAYNLKFKKHEVFPNKLVVVDEKDTPFLWLDEESGEVSFGGKYFNLYKEQKLIELLKEFVYLAHEHVVEGEPKDDYTEIFEKLLNKFDELNEEFAIKKE